MNGNQRSTTLILAGVAAGFLVAWVTINSKDHVFASTEPTATSTMSSYVLIRE